MTVPPVLCFTCGKHLAHLYEEYQIRLKKGEESGKILDSLGLKRLCCRRMLLTALNN